jgi:hypothetical protein
MDNYCVSFLCFLNTAFRPERRVKVFNVFGNGMVRRIFEQEEWTKQGMESVLK